MYFSTFDLFLPTHVLVTKLSGNKINILHVLYKDANAWYPVGSYKP